MGTTHIAGSNNPASSWNPFQGTVKEEKTSTKGIQLPGLGKVTKDDSFGNFTLRKIYNSIKYAPGHALLACGRFFSYSNNSSEKTSDNPLAHQSLPSAQVSKEESSFKKLTDFLYPTRTVQNFIHNRPDLFILDTNSMKQHNEFAKNSLEFEPPSKEQLTDARNFWLDFDDNKFIGIFDHKLKGFYKKNNLANRTNKEPQTEKEINDALALFLLYKDCLDLEKTDNIADANNKGNKINTVKNIFHLIPPSFLKALKVQESSKS